ncbi:MAG: AMP-binding protein [Proteobacteria bacterium]|nr:AMP-binding protein [Pseudomonadota bacterium]
MNDVSTSQVNQKSQQPLTSGDLTLPQTLIKQAQLLGSKHIAIRQKAFGIWKTFTWEDYLEYTKAVALGLKSLGLERGSNVALILDNDPEWLFSELAVQSLGAVTINLFTSAVSKEILFGINRIQAKYVIAQDQEQVDKLLENRNEIPGVKKVVYIDPTGMRNYRDNNWLISFADLLELGKTLDREQPKLFIDELQQGKPDDTALMIMTSGTTGLPKMVMLSHANFSDMSAKWLSTSPISTGDNWISISPPAWIVDQMWGVGVTLFGGLTMNFPENHETVTEDFREVGPSIIITSSRFWEDLASRIRVKMTESGFIKRLFFNLAQKIGLSVTRKEEASKRVSVFLKLLKWFANVTVYRPLMDRVGCLQFKAAYTGGHPISPEVIRFFRINGLNLKQCYGMTEAGGIFQVQPDGEVKPETVGKALPGTEIKITDDEEVLVKSKSTFQGYYQNPEATAEAIEDGWFKTGDAGYFDEDGHLVILGRKQDIMRTREGDPFSPDFIETRLKFSPYIKEAVIWGEGQPYLSAFINIDFENVGVWAEERKIPYTTYIDLSGQPEVEKLICEEVESVNNTLPEAMQLTRILLLYKLLDADDEELTRTGKVRRKFVADRYADLIEALYSDKTELEVRGQVNYRDGTTGIIESTIKIISLY